MFLKTAFLYSTFGKTCGIFFKRYMETGNANFFKFLMVLDKVESHPSPSSFADTFRMVKRPSWIWLRLCLIDRSSHLEVFYTKGVLRNFAKFTGNNLWQSLFIKKETLAQMFSFGFYEISKNTFFYRTPPVAASAVRQDGNLYQDKELMNMNDMP